MEIVRDDVTVAMCWCSFCVEKNWRRERMNAIAWVCVCLHSICRVFWNKKPQQQIVIIDYKQSRIRLKNNDCAIVYHWQRFFHMHIAHCIYKQRQAHIHTSHCTMQFVCGSISWIHQQFAHYYCNEWMNESNRETKIENCVVWCTQFQSPSSSSSLPPSAVAAIVVASSIYGGTQRLYADRVFVFCSFCRKKCGAINFIFHAETYTHTHTFVFAPLVQCANKNSDPLDSVRREEVVEWMNYTQNPHSQHRNKFDASLHCLRSLISQKCR